MRQPLFYSSSKLGFLFFSFGILLLSTSLQGQNRKAVKYNNALVLEQHKVVPHIIDFFDEHMKHGCSLEKALKEKERIELLLDKGIEKVMGMKSYNGNDTLRLMALKWLKAYKYTFDVDFETAIPLLSKKEKSPEERLKLKTMQERLFEEEEKIDEEFENTQLAFARKYHLEMVDLPMEASK